MAFPVLGRRPDSKLRLILAAALVLIAAVLAMIPSRASAGDLAAWQVVGYSQDGSHFAFAEYGRQDGSGFPYAALYVVDLDQDRYVGGAPFRVLPEDDQMSIGEALAQVHAQAEGTLADYGISQPARLVAADPPTEHDANPRQIAFNPIPGLTSNVAPRRLTLTTVNLPDKPICQQMGDTYGFALALDGVEVYRDTSIPKSRNCPLDYQVAAIVMPMEAPFDRAVAIISVIQVGFEGPRRRVIAVPISF
ncbi:DUF2259 domain-containing protein [Tepidamorphus sp. 3E244]|uniref:DUF2259 domain-containing protein n=1 Tax=Tepidamorphus sp. 3E244 TaxID=3385498 RepID=UPI0038FC8D0F